MQASNVPVIKDLKDKLSDAQKVLFRQTCFGHFFDVNDIFLHQLVHHVLLREVFQPNCNEMWFDFSSKIFRFGIKELSITTNLSCDEVVDISRIEPVENLFRDWYFDGEKKN